MKFIYENMLKTYMSLADDIFGYNQKENPSVQDAIYEAVNSNKFISMIDDDDVPLAKKHYEQLKKMKSADTKHKGKYSSGKKMIKTYTTSKMEIIKETKIKPNENNKKNFEDYVTKYKSDNQIIPEVVEQSNSKVDKKNINNKFGQQEKSEGDNDNYKKYKKVEIVKETKEIKKGGNYSGVKNDKKIEKVDRSNLGKSVSFKKDKNEEEKSENSESSKFKAIRNRYRSKRKEE